MTNTKMRFAELRLVLLLAVALAPKTGWACACGCGVFDVGTGLMLPEGAGGMVYVNYDYQDQDHNWSGTSSAPAANNGDKEIRTDFVTVGLQYMFDRSWGLQVEVPYDYRYFKTTGGASGSDIVALDWASLGDIRVEGIYTGFSQTLLSRPNPDWPIANSPKSFSLRAMFHREHRGAAEFAPDRESLAWAHHKHTDRR